MSVVTGISNIGGGFQPWATGLSSQPAVPQPAPAARPAPTPAPAIDRSFVMQGVQDYLTRFRGGEFDDTRIAAQLAASQGQLAQSMQAHTAAIGSGMATSGGASAGPAAGAGVFDASSGVIRDEATVQRLLVQQAEARYANIDAALRSDFPLADTLPSAESGWDPATFVPTTPQQAEAFSQRLVADATRAAARLEVMVATRDAAEVVARTTGDMAARAKLGQLDGLIEQQLAQVDKLARLVDTSSAGTVTDAGAAALRAANAPGAPEALAGIRGVASAARRFGNRDQVVERVVGAAVLGRERVSGRRGAEQRLTSVAAEVATFTWTNRNNLEGARSAEERRIEQRRVEERRQEERDRQERDDQFAAYRKAEFEAWQRVRTFVLRREQRSSEDFQALLRAIDERRGVEPAPDRQTVGQWLREQRIEREDG